MRIPENLLDLRGSEFLDFMADGADYWSQYFRAERNGEKPGPEAIAFSNFFAAQFNMVRTLKFRQESHIAQMAKNRADGKRVFYETDQTVDAAISAARSAFMMPKPGAKKP